MVMSIKLLLSVLDKVEETIVEFEDGRDGNIWIAFTTYVVVSYALSLRSNEGFLLDLAGLSQFQSSNDGTYFIIALLGKIKGEDFDRRHLIPCSNVTSSGIQVKSIVDQLRVHKSTAGFRDGPAISDTK